MFRFISRFTPCVTPHVTLQGREIASASNLKPRSSTFDPFSRVISEKGAGGEHGTAGVKREAASSLL